MRSIRHIGLQSTAVVRSFRDPRAESRLSLTLLDLDPASAMLGGMLNDRVSPFENPASLEQYMMEWTSPFYLVESIETRGTSDKCRS